MTRTTEVEILAAALEEPARALLRAALVAQRQGRLDAAARVTADQCMKRPALRWPALLMALDSAELRQGGAVAYTTPVRIAAGDAEKSVFYERWRPFSCTIYPDAVTLVLQLVSGSSGDATPLVLRATANGAVNERCAEAVSVLAKEVEAHLGVGVKSIKSWKKSDVS